MTQYKYEVCGLFIEEKRQFILSILLRPVTMNTLQECA